MTHKTLKPLVLMLGGFALAGSAFAMTPLSQGYQVAPGDDKAEEEGRCGEGSCGADHDAAAADGKAKEEGKCGEGQCGADGKAHEEGKCGEGQCGEDKKADAATAEDAAQQ